MVLLCRNSAKISVVKTQNRVKHWVWQTRWPVTRPVTRFHLYLKGRSTMKEVQATVPCLTSSVPFVHWRPNRL